MTPDQNERLVRLIEVKKWGDFDFSAHYGLRTIDAIEKMLRGLRKEEIDLTLDLLDEYLIIKSYNSHARELMVRLGELAKKQNVLVTPVVDYKSTRTKSGPHLHWDMSNFAGLIPKSSIKFYDNPNSPLSLSHIGFHVSVDDFIGTGNQFFSMIQKIKDDGNPINVTHVATICIQEEAKNAIEQEGFDVISIFVREKGLKLLSKKGNNTLSSIEEKYDKLERRISCNEKYVRGRDKSEALVTMKATPNNTLPIFWFEGRHSWPAPFPRPVR